ncbi:MAG: tripartite tricarboxylate transporter TctB family protein [Angelakisella sp.]|nr:tripartite tricarboxylate transporter TctB family protein [Angelakisella sp.]
MSTNSKDILISIVFIIFSIFFLLLIIPMQIPLPKYSSGGTTPRAIPMICCYIIIAMSGAMFVRTILRDRLCITKLLQELRELLNNRAGWKIFGYVMLVFALSVAYYIGFETIGFFITTLVLFPVYAFALGCRKLVVIAITDLVLTFGVYYSFLIFLNCYLPGWAPFI